MRYFFDTSAFTKNYHWELGSARVAEIFSDLRSVIRISDLTIVEAQSSFAMKVRTGAWAESDAEKAMDRVFDDLLKHRLAKVILTPSTFEKPRALIAKYGYTRRLRTLDALQLAVALDLHRRGSIDKFVVAD